jgi:hypothetical protein
MARVLENFPWSEDLLPFQAHGRVIYWMMLLLLMLGCGLGGGKGEDFSCQGLGGFTVSGTVTFQKRLFDRNGFTGQSVFLPARFAKVEIIGPDDKALATATTDEHGRYCAIYIKTGAPTENRVSVTASTNVPTVNAEVGFVFGIQPPDSEEVEFHYVTYGFSKPFEEIQGESAYIVNLEMVEGRAGAASNPGGVFNILDTITKGSEFFRTVRGEIPPLVTVIWQADIGGTFFVTEDQCNTLASGFSSACIFIQGDGEILFGQLLGGDRDEYDDDIILHEYGHFIAHHFSTDTSPGGIHFLNSHTQDIRLSWSEGWATFFSSAVRKNPINVDVGFDGPPLFAFSIDSNSILFPILPPGTLEKDVIYTTSEVAVSSVLWDIFDSADFNEPFDHLALGFGPIFDIFKLWRQTPPLPDTTMEAFWESFGQVLTEFTPDHLSISQERQMEFKLDACEMSDACSDFLITKLDDNAPENATPAIVNGPSQHHTLFPRGDRDYMSFEPEAGKPYTIETFNLTNAADTHLEVLYLNGDGQEILLGTNDNPGNKVFAEGCAQLQEGPDGELTAECPNNKTAFASKVVISNFVLPPDCFVPCRLFAKIIHSPNAPPSTGLMGSYDFRVTSP